MAKESSATETPVTPAATGTPETPASTPAGESAQEIVATQAVEKLQAELDKATAALKQLELERNNAVANAVRSDAQYKDLQHQTTKTLQKAAEDRRALAVAQMQAQEIGDIKQLLNTVIGKVLDEDSAKEFTYAQKDLELKRREAAIEALKNAPVEPEPEAEPQNFTTPENEKAQFLSYYFPGVDVDPSDPNIDWGVGAQSTPEAFRRFTTSVLNIKAQKDSTKANDAVVAVQKQATEQLEAVKKQIEDLASKSVEEIAAAKAAAAEEARKEAEKRLRAMGADVSGAAPSDGSGRKTFGQQMEEAVPDSLLTTKKGQEQYAKNLEAIKKQVRENFQR
jgi:hypothetical protein